MAQEIYFRDFPLNPTITSEGDMSSVENKDAIKQSLRMMINTNKGSRIFAPDYGCRVMGFLFEPFDETTGKRLGAELEETIKNYEPRVELININVSMIMQSSSYEVSVVYRIRNTQTLDTFNITLEKL